jgi:LmbE family N-acetylglucosaminyl deacetylase
MELVVNEGRLGPSEREWFAAGRLQALSPISVTRPRRVVVVSPHPDDEVFGSGGLLQALQLKGIPIAIVAVTDGEASHPVDVGAGFDLRTIRASESATALQRLGLGRPVVERLRLPDGRIAGHLDSLISTLNSFLSRGDLCLAPWLHDGHPDHDACGKAALAATRSTESDLLWYLVWAWHWADPRAEDLPWAVCRRFDFERRMAARKRWATRAFVSQTQQIGSDHEGGPVLPARVLRRFWRSFEVFVDPQGVGFR